MELEAFAAAQPIPGTGEATDSITTAGWATFLLMGVLVVVFVCLLTAAVFGLLGKRTRE